MELLLLFIEVRADDFRRFEEDGSRRRWWSSVRSVATLESQAEISFRLRVRNSCLSLMECRVDCDVYAQAKVVVLMYMNII